MIDPVSAVAFMIGVRQRKVLRVHLRSYEVRSVTGVDQLRVKPVPIAAEIRRHGIPGSERVTQRHDLHRGGSSGKRNTDCTDQQCYEGDKSFHASRRLSF